MPKYATFKENFAQNARIVTGASYESIYLGKELYHMRHENGTEEWFRDGQRRLVKYPDGGKFWYKDDKLRLAQYTGDNAQVVRHFNDGLRRCAYPDGSTYYYKNDELHCETGPAVTQARKRVEFWLEGRQMTEEAFREIAPQLVADKKLRVFDVEVRAMDKGLKKPVKPMRQIRLRQKKP